MVQIDHRNKEIEMTNQINNSRAALVTGKWNAKPIKLTVARPSVLGYLKASFLRLVGVHNA
jgi:hypothetical protein